MHLLLEETRQIRVDSQIMVENNNPANSREKSARKWSIANLLFV
jgi:hypothetical protein